MEVKSTLRPGDPGTQALIERFGDSLVCIRYRYDAGKRKRYKTVELIVEEETWCEGIQFLSGPGFDNAARRPVLVRVGKEEHELRTLVVEHQAHWVPERAAWRLRYDQAVKLGLCDRILEE